MRSYRNRISVFLLCLAATGQSLSQNETGATWSLSNADKEEQSQLAHHISSMVLDLERGENLGLGAGDAAILRQALHDNSFMNPALEILQEACEYYLETEKEQIRIETLASYLAEANRAELKEKLNVYRKHVATLSGPAKAALNSRLNASAINPSRANEESSVYSDYYNQIIGIGLAQLSDNLDAKCPTYSDYVENVAPTIEAFSSEPFSLQGSNND